jgi:transposase
MIDYQTYCQIRHLFTEKGLGVRQIARQLKLGINTVRKWAGRESYQRAPIPKRTSKLDPFKGQIVALLEQHDYSAQQILQRIQEAGYPGRYSILRAFVQQVRPEPRPAFLTLHFEPGECAQVDWGCAGSVPVGSTHRRLSFFLMVLAFSRKMYLEFTLAETLEHFLSCHQHAWEYFGGVVRQVWVDNAKVAVLSRATGAVVFNPRYLDFANHYGFQLRACGVRQPQEKGRVENGVGYVKKNFLHGLELSDFAAVNPAARYWLDTVANVRVHGQTHQKPQDLFAQEKLKPLHPVPYEAAVLETVRVNSQFRIQVDGNRYSVPCRYASSQLTLKRFADRLLLCDKDKLVAEHVRRYDRHQDYELPDHVAPLLVHRQKAREQKLFLRFLTLCPKAHDYYQQLEARRLNPKHHVQKIVALSEIYGAEAVARALEDAFTFEAFSCEYIANLLAQRQHPPQEPGALHLTRQQDLLELELPAPDLSLYDTQHSPNPPDSSTQP